MKHTWKIAVTIIIMILSLSMISGEEYLEKEVLTIINETVFEIVIKKPTEDSLTYEKELPLDLIPYAIRTDEYYSIGTAFAISENRFATAAHVLNLEYKTQNRNLYIRNTSKEIFEIDKIYSYSNNRDFVVFSVKKIKIDKTLELNPEPVINEEVFAVGNAYGEGVIVRNGIYTSNTPENEDGKWEWLRFSAAASPGNSGGPLLDKQGKIIGLITMKSKNENLNYALPIKELLDFSKNKAVYHKKSQYSMMHSYKIKQNEMNYETELPLSYKELSSLLTKELKTFFTGSLDALLKENKETIFPYGNGSLNVLHNSYSAIFPNLICEGDDGNWEAFYPKDTKESELDNNGFLRYGSMLGIDIYYLKKPDNIKLKDICSDSKLFMDLILKGSMYSRKIQSENIRITSLGKAVNKYEFIDNYNRKWLVRIWNIEYNDYKLITYSLVIPGGMITLLKFDYTGYIDLYYQPNIEVLTDFIYLSYYGTFKQWNEFFNNKTYLPEVFSKIKFDYSVNNSTSFKSNRFAFQYNNKLFNITDNSDMRLNFSYFKDKNNEVVWDMEGIMIGEEKANKNYFYIYREIKPAKGLKEAYYTEWEKICSEKYPYNNKSYFYEDGTYIQSLAPEYSKLDKDDISNKKYLYLTKMALEGKVSDFIIKKKLRDINNKIELFE